LASAVVHGFRYWQLDRGSADTVLCLHGLGGDHRGLAEFAAALPDVNVVIPDLPGYGRSAPMSDPHSLVNYADAVADLRHALGLDTCHLLGHSLDAALKSRVLDQLGHLDPRLDLSGRRFVRKLRHGRAHPGLETRVRGLPAEDLVQEFSDDTAAFHRRQPGQPVHQFHLLRLGAAGSDRPQHRMTQTQRADLRFERVGVSASHLR